MSIKQNVKAKRHQSATKKFLEKLSGPLTFANMLESTRLADELTMEAFSKKLGISVSHLNDIEKGRKSVSPERAAFFAKKLGYSESQYVRLALQDVLNRAGLDKYKVALDEAA